MDKELIEVIKDLLENASFYPSAIEICNCTGEYNGEEIENIFKQAIAQLEVKEQLFKPCESRFDDVFDEGIKSLT